MYSYQTEANISLQNFDNNGDQLDQNPNNISQYLIFSENNNNNNTPEINTSESGRSRKSRNSTTTCIDNTHNGKKVIHREIERQRRQEMSNLFSSLRSILPPDYIRGKRSVSEHVAQAVNYIKDMEKNVKELGEKRDELKKWVGSNCLSSSSSSSCRNNEGGSGSRSVKSSAFLPSSVSIHQVKGGLEIAINVSSQNEGGFSLANALQVVFQQGLNVTSCTSTNVNGRMIHNLTCEVNNVACIDVYRIQQRLVDLVS